MQTLLLRLAALLTIGTVGAPAVAAAQSQLTFVRDIAPLIWQRCGECHRPGGAAPFSLLTYDEVRRHARQIVDATRRGYMPPWIPDEDGNQFTGDRRMAPGEASRLSTWLDQGMVEGEPSALPPMPSWPDRWRTGTPDLILPLPEYVVPPTDDRDVFRNFAVDVPLDDDRYVRGFEFLPSNSAVHHANIFVDTTDASRVLDAADPAPGYAGLIPYSAKFPDGHFLGWTPGQAAPLEPDSIAWTLRRRSSLLVQLHLKATGKAETIRPVIGLYFGRRQPTERTVALRLGRQDIDIAPDDARYRVFDSFQLPADAQLYAVQAHSHYRARSVRAVATRPDGVSLPLLTISTWDFNWQDVYRYASPIVLPKGSTVSIEYVLDNSASNPRNPSTPPARAVWGFRSSDEMADIWLQLSPSKPSDQGVLEQAADAKMSAEAIVGYETQIRVNPDYIPTRNDVAVLYMESGRPRDAVPHFAHVVSLQPASAPARFNLGRALQMSGQVDEAIKAYGEALRLDPTYQRAASGLAESHYMRAFTHDQAGRFVQAAAELRLAVSFRPDWPDALSQLTWVLATSEGLSAADREESVRTGERAREITAGRSAECLDSLSAAYASVGRFADAIKTAEDASRLAARSSPALVAQIDARLRTYRSGRAVVRAPTITRP